MIGLIRHRPMVFKALGYYQYQFGMTQSHIDHEVEYVEFGRPISVSGCVAGWTGYGCGMQAYVCAR